ncbi:MAG: carbamoyltransferase HypF [Candidatus Wukongarchaeota archaeon]|nr:carbamoyltransferase HypF [Candidatus Wukongarchaeota archaeon]
MVSNNSRRAVTLEVLCSGVVQGVGFRPFVYRIAVDRGVQGFVQNLGDAGVRIVVRGSKDQVDGFLRDLEDEKHPIVVYDEIIVREISSEDFSVVSGDWVDYFTGKGFGDIPGFPFDAFHILKSSSERRVSSSHIPIDVAVCDDCLRDIDDRRSRYFGYAFTNCTVCGPRFSIILETPYDRERTTMADFPMCVDCKKEYSNPVDRRFHAQGITGPVCGPQYALYDSSGEVVDIGKRDPIIEVAKLINEGFVVAVKGIGGTHIACRASVDDYVLRMREKRKKSDKPFAVMSFDISSVETFAEVSPGARALLLSWRRPIVLLPKKDPFPLSEYISPGLHNIGVILPYAPVHYILLRDIEDPAVIMTSGNAPNYPMIVDNKEAINRLGSFVDYFLLHNRVISNRCDDSVVRFIGDSTAIIRRSRGYVPEPIILPFDSRVNVVGVGPDLNVTGSVCVGKRVYATQHIGDTDNLDCLMFLEAAVRHLMKLGGVKSLEGVGCDMNPVFQTRILAETLAEEYGCSLFEVQHHHAHSVKLMVDNAVPRDEEIVTIAADGVGYGFEDEPAWGGEIFLSSYTGFKRLASLQPHPMPGGDLCAYYPARMLAGILSSVLSEEEVRDLLVSRCLAGFRHGVEEIDTVLLMLRKGLNVVDTTSTGRILDAVSSLLGVCYYRSYEGEPAMKLESLALKASDSSLVFPIEFSSFKNRRILLTSRIFEEVLNALKRGETRASIAYGVHRSLAQGLAELAVFIAEEHGVDCIGFTGGVAYNELFNVFIRRFVENAGYRFLNHKNIPPGDAGISVGQAAFVAGSF